MNPNPQADLRSLCRRLRYLRRHPNPFSYQANNPSVRLGMAQAYEYALRVVIDEMGERENFHALFYGSQGEDPDINGNILGN